MKERATAGRPASARRPGKGAGAVPAPPVVARALELQRQVGNRVASRVLARWIKHPDTEQKGVMVPDVVADEFVRLNPPTNG
ncbi:MAG TPA: hypothetical protein VFU10_10760 [Gaiellaceae bacterium]|nr:hypothetical protein [Gaiellaceae bacterium]